MLRRLVLWWRVRKCESDLRFLRRLLRERPDDPKPKELIPLVEKEYQALRVEEVCRRHGWRWSFSCQCCGRENIAYSSPVECVFCGLDAPPNVKMTVPELQASNGEPQVREKT